MLAPAMEKALGRPVVVENKAGASGQMGVNEAAQSKPDGTTIGQIILPTIINTYMDESRAATYNRSSFAVLGMQWDEPVGVVVKADSKYKTLKDFVDDAKANPGNILAGHPGKFTTIQLGGLQFVKSAGIDVQMVDFAGSGPGLVGLLGGQVNVFFAGASDAAAMVKSGEIRPLAWSSKYQFGSDVPIYKDLGYDVSVMMRTGYGVPTATPKDVVDALRAAMKTASEDASYKEQMKTAQFQANYASADDFATMWAEQEKTVAPILESQGVKLKK